MQRMRKPSLLEDSDMDELISIIVPVYNAEKTLERCVRSLMGQTYENIEIILVNDGSKDNSLNLCRQFAAGDSRIVVIDKPNGGVSSARNAGLDVARGEFVMFCDSDDWVEPEWCQVLYEAYQPEMLVMCGCYVEGQQDVLPHEIKAASVREIHSKRNFSELYLCCFNAPWNKIYLRSTIEDKKLRFDQRIRNGEDYLFNVGYLSRIEGDILFLDKCVHHYSWPTGESLSSKADPKAFERSCILFRGLMHETKKFMQPGDLPEGFYAPFFWRFESEMLRVVNADIPFSEKYAKLHESMSADEYQTVVGHVTCFGSKLYGKVCCSRNPIWFILWNSASKAVHRRRNK